MSVVDILTNRTVEGFAIGEHELRSLTISGGYSLNEESLLRYVSEGGVFISASDHMHQFGLPAPYDAEKEIRRMIVGKVIRRVEVGRDANAGGVRHFPIRET